MKNLDKLDRRILYELDLNSRQPISDLARRLNQGRDMVEYRVERMIRGKIIQRFIVSVDLYKLGYTVYKIYIRLENNKSKVAEFVEHIANHPRTYWYALSDGSWDLMFCIFATNPHEFHEIYTDLLSEFNEVVLNFNIYTIVYVAFYGRNYLYKSAPTEIELGEKPGLISVDRTDLKILHHLARDARTPNTVIANKLNVTHQVVKYRIEQMEKAKIINGYRLELKLDKLNMLFFKTQFFLRNYEKGLREQFRKYCQTNPNIVMYIEQLGDCNIEVEIEASSYEEYSDIIDEIRGEYSKLVRNFNSILIRKHDRYAVPMQIKTPQAAYLK